MSQFVDQFRKRIISQLIKGISRVLRKLSTYLNGKAISTSSVTSLPVLFISLRLNLNHLCFHLAHLSNIAKTC